jgi:hypothetical protein
MWTVLPEMGYKDWDRVTKKLLVTRKELYRPEKNLAPFGIFKNSDYRLTENAALWGFAIKELTGIGKETTPPSRAVLAHQECFRRLNSENLKFLTAQYWM